MEHVRLLLQVDFLGDHMDGSYLFKGLSKIWHPDPEYSYIMLYIYIYIYIYNVIYMGFPFKLPQSKKARV